MSNVVSIALSPQRGWLYFVVENAMMCKFIRKDIDAESFLLPSQAFIYSLYKLNDALYALELVPHSRTNFTSIQ